MKTRNLTLLFVIAAGASFAFGACGTEPTPLDPTVDARLRNNLPSACTAEKIAACPAVDVVRCPAGQEPVIDYSSDCCAHFTCQPFCSSAQQRSCPMTPAPVCPPRTKLWIGTAIEDCCPAYRCEPDGTTCDPMRGETCGCEATNVACTLALPYCGPNVQPIVVGQTADCCPIYQCPCAVPTPVDPMTGDGTPPPAMDTRYCGCTTPNCRAGEQVVCDGQDVCGGPCYCKPAQGVCRDDSSCAADQKCDLSACRLPPDAASPMAPLCDPIRCGGKPEIATRMCADGSIAGVTDRCLLGADGTCTWEIRDCSSDCFGICVPDVPQTGCQVDSDCPMGQGCNVQCREWSCAPGGTGTGTPTMTDPATGMTPPPSACACDLADNSCMCDATGVCKGQVCIGQCAPKTPTCDPMKPAVCPTIAPVCPNGQMPIPNGIDPATCCQTYTCPICDPRALPVMTSPSICPAVRCACAKVVGTDPASCCPKYECGPVDASGKCL
jgi:hypothetical protein